MKKEISSRAEVKELVSAFYSKIQEEEVLGPIFNKVIDNWEEHIELLTDFWESNLLFKAIYKGNPHKAHVDVDKSVGGTITENHFGIWLQLWFQTIDELFIGEKAELAKNRARKMSTMLFIKIFNARQ